MDNTFISIHPNKHGRHNHIIGDVKEGIGFIKDIGKEASKIVKTDAVLIRTRDKIFSIFKSAGFGPGTSALDTAASVNKMGHKSIPNRKIGNDYNEEWSRLYNMVTDVFNNMGRSDLANEWQNSVPVFDEKNHDISYISDLLKGRIRKNAVPTQDKINKLPSSVRENVKVIGPGKMTERILIDQTAPETLPKTAPQKQLEREIINGSNGNALSSGMQLDLKSPIVLFGIFMLFVAVIVAIVNR